MPPIGLLLVNVPNSRPAKQIRNFKDTVLLMFEPIPPIHGYVAQEFASDLEPVVPVACVLNLRHMFSWCLLTEFIGAQLTLFVYGRQRFKILSQ